eukprot:TRINITY_DN363_c0_g1_i2.p1 TRINITY_DN363_c0_g1~~TRINITY_DN363_c0_g1_i2.p1  ORF type:complete len:489 (-),score=79.91 TRINITY_DN363_c0_g1_i2:121-1503(-)
MAAFSVLFGLCASQVEAWNWWQEPALRRLQMNTMTCEDVEKAYEMQGCCGNPGKPFAMPTGGRLQGMTGDKPVYCKNVKDAYRQMKCCSKTSAGDDGMYSIDFSTDSSGCSITFPDYGTCVVPGLGGKCCGYYVGLMEKGTPEADYEKLLGAAAGDGTCGQEEMSGFTNLEFLRCVRGAAGSQAPSGDSSGSQAVVGISVDFSTDSSGCQITFPGAGGCYVPGLESKCCGYYVGLMEKGTPEADYEKLLGAAAGDGTCGQQELIGFTDKDFLRCVTGLTGSQDSRPQMSMEEQKEIYFSADTDDDNTLSFEEFLLATAKVNGFESVDEWSKAQSTSLEEMMAEAKKQLGTADSNQDGTVTMDEVRAYFEAAGSQYEITFKADGSGGCEITFPQGSGSYTCKGSGLGEKCCGYYVELINKNTPESEYESLFGSAVADGTCVPADLKAFDDATFMGCLTGGF